MPTIIFNGHKYFKGRGGYYSLSNREKHKYPEIERRLHRAIWVFHNGPIPKGYHVHHKDHNTENNDISNLEVLSPSVHSMVHNSFGQSAKWWHSKEGRAANKRGREKCKEWHASEEGYKWHSEHQKETMSSDILFLIQIWLYITICINNAKKSHQGNYHNKNRR